MWYVFAFVASFFVQKISKRLGDEVSQMNMYMQVAVLHHSELQLVALYATIAVGKQP